MEFWLNIVRVIATSVPRIAMSCTAEEIAEKRRIAIERLNARKSANSGTNKQTGSVLTAKSVQASVAAAAAPNPNSNAVHGVGSFYGHNENRNTIGKIPAQRQPAVPYARPSQTQKKTPSKVAPIFVRTVTCSLSLISEERFIADTNGYHEQMIEVFKQIPSRSYGKPTEIRFQTGTFPKTTKNILLLP